MGRNEGEQGQDRIRFRLRQTLFRVCTCPLPPEAENLQARDQVAGAPAEWAAGDTETPRQAPSFGNGLQVGVCQCSLTVLRFSPRHAWAS